MFHSIYAERAAGFILQAIANEFEVEIFSERDGDDPSYVPLGKPTD